MGYKTLLHMNLSLIWVRILRVHDYDLAQADTHYRDLMMT